MVIVAPSASDARRALIVDPSTGVLDALRAILDAEGATVDGVLLTHGHPDHVWDSAEVARWADNGAAPVWIPGPDRYRMDDPLASIAGLPAGIELSPWERPQSLRDMPAGSVELIGGLWMKMVPAPGHTEGSALFIAHTELEVCHDGAPLITSTMPVPWALSGDVIFAGSVGRTDLIGGDETQMRHSLRTVANALDPATILFPGHGPTTTLGDELKTNPYLLRACRLG